MRVLVSALAVAVVVSIPILVMYLLSKDTPKSGPPKELAQAARLLDQVRASDDAIPQLPIGLRKEVDIFLNRFYKELK